MFGTTEKRSIEAFLKISQRLVDLSPAGLTKTDLKAFAKVVERTRNSELGSFDSLVHALKPQTRKKRASGRSRGTSKPETTEALVGEVASELMKVSSNGAAFEIVMMEMIKKHRASTMKKVAIKFSPGARPKNTEDVKRILLASRNESRRLGLRTDNAKAALDLNLG